MATQPNVGAMAAFYTETAIVPSQVSGMAAMVLVSVKEDDGNLFAPIHVSSMYGFVTERVLSSAKLGGVFALTLVSEKEQVIPDATGALLNQVIY